MGVEEEPFRGVVWQVVGLEKVVTFHWRPSLQALASAADGCDQSGDNPRVLFYLLGTLTLLPSVLQLGLRKWCC